jgi:Mn2+/Fe2+ NRAMP family transporter
MGVLVNRWFTTALAAAIAVLVIGLNVWLLVSTFMGG